MIEQIAKRCIALGLYIDLWPDDKVGIYHNGTPLTKPLTYAEAATWLDGYKDGREMAFDTVSEHVHRTIKGLK